MWRQESIMKLVDVIFMLYLCYIYVIFEANWPQMRQIRDFSRSDFSTVWLGDFFRSYFLTKTWSEKSRICSILGQSDPVCSHPWHPWFDLWQFDVTGDWLCNLVSWRRFQLSEMNNKWTAVPDRHRSVTQQSYCIHRAGLVICYI